MIDAPAGPAPGAIVTLRLPEPRLLFERRSARLAELAREGAAGDYLALLSRIARGQARAVREVRSPPAVPGGGPTPLAAAKVACDGTWRRMLAAVLADADGPELPPEARRAILRLRELGAPGLEAIADEVLAGEIPRDRPDALAAAPFVGAALQAWFATMAASLDAARVDRSAAGCPVCGSPPVAAVVNGDDRLRYLACALCGAQWHLERVRCSACGGTEGLAYFGVEAEPGAGAEACGGCRAYLKLFDLAKRPRAEPLADDAATLALDLLMAEEGYGRIGVNLLFAAAAAAR